MAGVDRLALGGGGDLVPQKEAALALKGNYHTEGKGQGKITSM